MSKEQTYGEYLCLDKILSAQKLASNNEHDETLFIIIHQVYELWIKQILHEMGYFKTQLENDKIDTCKATLSRVLKILKVMVSQLDVLETLTPLNYSSFRDQLQSSSGFQSFQFRQLEFFLGVRNKMFFSFFKDQPELLKKLEDAYEGPALYDLVIAYLKTKDYVIPDSLLNRDRSTRPAPSEELQNVLLDIYHNNPSLAALCESLVDLDEGLQEWRYRHVKMVERTIGNKPGTGGSSGVEYLKQTLFKSFFEDLWQVRSKF
jgi:tryptophan 2,3-dioxygenase